MKAKLEIDGPRTTITQESDEETTVKDIYTTDLIKLFTSKNMKTETPFLPIGTMKHVVNGSLEYVLFVEPEKEVTLKYEADKTYRQAEEILRREGSAICEIMENEDQLTIRSEETREADEDYDDSGISDVIYFKTIMPKTAWFVLFYTQNGQKRLSDSSQVFALKDDIITEDSRIYNFPFPNIFNNHTVCWGEDLRLSDYLHMQGLSTKFFNIQSNLDIPNRSIKLVEAGYGEEGGGQDPFILHYMMDRKEKEGVELKDRRDYLHEHFLSVNEDTLLERFNRFANISSNTNSDEDDSPEMAF